MNIYRHGDLLLIQGAMKDNIVIDDSNIVMAGVTGHNHKLNNGKLYKSPEEPSLSNDYFIGNVIIEEGKTGSLTHEEHDVIELTEGIYECYCQREYDPIEERRVLD